MYKENVEWLKNAKELMKDYPVCDSFMSDYSHKEKEVFIYELTSFRIIMNSINNNIDDIDFISGLLDSSNDSDITIMGLEEINNRKNNILDYCSMVDNFYLKDNIINFYNSLKDDCNKVIEENSKHICTFAYNNSYVQRINEEKRKLKDINSSLLILSGKGPEIIIDYTDKINNSKKLVLK